MRASPDVKTSRQTPSPDTVLRLPTRKDLPSELSPNLGFPLPHNSKQIPSSLTKDIDRSEAPSAASFKPSYTSELSPNLPIPTQGNAMVHHSFFPRHSSLCNININARPSGSKSGEELRAILRSTRSEVAHLSRALRQQAEQMVNSKAQLEQQRRATLDAEAEAAHLSHANKLLLEQNEVLTFREAVLLDTVSILYARLDKESQTGKTSSASTDLIEQGRGDSQLGLEFKRPSTGTSSSTRPSSLSSLFSSFRETILDLQDELYYSNLNLQACDEERLRLEERVALLQKNMEICVEQSSRALETERELRADLERRTRLLLGRIAILKTSSRMFREKKSQPSFDIVERQALNIPEPHESNIQDSKVDGFTKEETLFKSETSVSVKASKQWRSVFWKLPRNLFFYFLQHAGRQVANHNEVLTKTSLAPARLTTIPIAIVHPLLAKIIARRRSDDISMNSVQRQALGRSLSLRVKEWALIGGTDIPVHDRYPSRTNKLPKIIFLYNNTTRVYEGK